jgi:DNA-binding SARP family transcriptional activator
VNNPSPWSFGVLGQLTAEHDGLPVALPGRRARALLAVLLMNRGRPLTVDQLIEAVWGDPSPATARSALHVHLSKIRSAVGDLLITSPAGYLLQEDAYELDADQLKSLIDASRRDPASARGLLTQALGLWRGEPLAELPAEGPIGEWRRMLTEQHLQAIILRIDAELADGAAGELVPELERLVRADPLVERLWEQLMLALYRAGRQADALDTYARARRLLATELGLEPGPGLKDLHTRILGHDPSLSSAPAAASLPARAGAAAASQIVLPQPTTRLIGRTVELLKLENLVDDPFCRLVTLVGPGGVERRAWRSRTRGAGARASPMGQSSSHWHA